MKRLSSIVLGLLALAPLAQAGGWTYENAVEFTTAGDFDGDGQRDIVIVDRASGQFRVGYGATGTTFWTDPQAGGMTGVTAVSAGRLIATNREALALTAPAANRVLVHDLSSTNGVPAPYVVNPPSIGPQCVLAIEMGGVSNTAHEDLFIGTSFNNSGLQQLDTLRNVGLTNLITLDTFPSSIALLVEAQGNPVESGGVTFVSAVMHGSSDRLRVLNVATGTITSAFQLTSISATSHFVCGFYNPATNLAQYLVYRAGFSNLTVYPVTKPTASTYAFGSGTSYTLTGGIAQVFMLENTNLLAVLSADRSALGLYSFNGVSAPALRQTLTASAGAVWSGLVPLSNGVFTALSGDPVSGISTSAQRYAQSGGVYVADGAVDALPAVAPSGGRANVMVFSGEPFVMASPRRLAALSAPAWSSNQSLGGTVQVYKERDRGPSSGLGSRASQSLGSAPAGSTHLLANQPHSSISVLSVDPASGADPCVVYATPAGGAYRSAVSVALASIPAGMPIRYRRNGDDSWTTYSAPVPLVSDDTLLFYGYTGTVSRTAMESESYTFAAAPDDQDADGDGVPDYVEIGYGLDPEAGSDTDEDGYSDFDELLLGTAPGVTTTNDLSLPEKRAAFDLYTTPRPFLGSLGVPSRARTGTAFHVYRMSGDLLAYSEATNAVLSGVTNPTVHYASLPADGNPALMVIGSATHFAFYANTNRAGRELVGLEAAPVLDPVSVPYTNAGGALAAEASNWVAAATGRWATVSRTNVIADLTLYDVLAAVVFERKVGQIFAGRGVVTNVDQFSLFSFRDEDAGMRAPTADELAALAFRSNSAPAYRLAEGFTNLSRQAHTAGGGVSTLRTLVTEIYRLSSLSNDVESGRYPLPVDELRHFIRTGQLSGAYTNQVLLNASQLTTAYGGVTTLLASVATRPVTTLNLRVTGELAPGACATLQTVGGATWSLFDTLGRPYDLTKTFALVTGAEIEVTGFADVSSGDCGGSGLEVESVSLTAIPVATGLDRDGDLLPDSWEMLAYGTLVNDGDGDADSDGYMALQEYLEGTDPEDASSFPGVAIADLSLPEVTISRDASGGAEISWLWPSRYQGEFDFVVESSSDLVGGSFADTGAAITSLADLMSLDVAPPLANFRHFRVRMGLR